jgi:putative ABC transport system permease protein
MWISNLRAAYRNLKRHKIYAAINIFGLSVSLAACWLIVLYVKDEWSYDRFHENAGRIVRVVQHQEWEGGNMHIALTSPPFAKVLKDAFPQIEEAVRIDAEGGDLIEHGSSILRVPDIISADPSFFQVFSFDFLEGDRATALSDPQSIVLTESLARTLFGSTESVVNQMVIFPGNHPAKVTGVIRDVPQNSHLRFSAVRSFSEPPAGQWQNSFLYTYLLLKNNSSLTSLQQQLPSFVREKIQKQMHADRYRVELQPLTSIHLRSDLDYEISTNSSMSRIYIFSAIALLILLIAIINYVNLATARASSRIKEIGIRKTLGSGKRQLAVLFITEAALVTVLAGLMALVLVRMSMPFFNQLTGKNISVWRFGFLPSLVFVVLFSVGVGLVSGIYPSLILARFQTIAALKGKMTQMGGTVFFRKSLLVLQFVITVFMISASFVIYEQLQFVNHADLGFNKDQILTFHIDNRSLRSQIPVIKSKLLESPLVESVAIAGNPVGNNDLGTYGYYYQDNAGVLTSETKAVQELMVDAEYLSTMQISLLEGRNFSSHIPTDTARSVLVNETLVRELGWTSALGKKVLSARSQDGQAKTVIGVFRDFHTYSFQHKVAPLVLILPPNVKEEDNLFVRLAKGKTNEGLAYVSEVYRGFDPGNPVEYQFLDQNYARQYQSEQKQGNLALFFTALAMILSLVGLFGLVSFTAQQLTREIGIRKVLGASLFQIIRLLSASYMQLILIAACIAIPVSWYVMHVWLSDFAYRIPLGIGIFAAAGSLSAIMALIVVGCRGLRAGRVNPVKSLRAD